MENQPAPHIGKMLREYTLKKRIYRAAWARHQNIKEQTVQGFFKKPSMQTTTLAAICHVLKYNFFADLAATFPADYGSTPGMLNQQVEALQKENEALKIQVELLKEMVRK